MRITQLSDDLATIPATEAAVLFTDEVNNDSDPHDPYSGCDPFDIIAQREEDGYYNHDR